MEFHIKKGKKLIHRGRAYSHDQVALLLTHNFAQADLDNACALGTADHGPMPKRRTKKPTTPVVETTDDPTPDKAPSK